MLNETMGVAPVTLTIKEQVKRNTDKLEATTLNKEFWNDDKVRELILDGNVVCYPVEGNKDVSVLAVGIQVDNITLTNGQVLNKASNLFSGVQNYTENAISFGVDASTSVMQQENRGANRYPITQDELIKRGLTQVCKIDISPIVEIEVKVVRGIIPAYDGKDKGIYKNKTEVQVFKGMLKRTWTDQMGSATSPKKASMIKGKFIMVTNEQMYAFNDLGTQFLREDITFSDGLKWYEEKLPPYSNLAVISEEFNTRKAEMIINNSGNNIKTVQQYKELIKHEETIGVNFGMMNALYYYMHDKIIKYMVTNQFQLDALPKGADEAKLNLFVQNVKGTSVNDLEYMVRTHLNSTFCGKGGFGQAETWAFIQKAFKLERNEKGIIKKELFVELYNKTDFGNARRMLVADAPGITNFTETTNAADLAGNETAPVNETEQYSGPEE